MKKVISGQWLVASALAMMLCTSCFKEIAPPNINPDNPGGGGTPNYTSGLLAHYSFNASNGADASGNNRDAAFYGEPNFVQGKRGNAVFLNFFKDEYFNVPYNLFKERSEWTVSFWIKDFGPGNIFAAQISNQNSSWYDEPVLWATQEGKFKLKQKNGSAEDNAGTTFSYSYTNHQADGNWHHVVVTSSMKTENYSTTNVSKLFIDGSLRDQVSCEVYQDGINECTKIAFGGNKDGGYDYGSSMKLDEVRFYSRELSNNDVKALYDYENN